MRLIWSLVFILMVLTVGSALCTDETPSPPATIVVSDKGSDDGSKLRVEWSPSPDEKSTNPVLRVERYRIMRREIGGQFEEVEEVFVGEGMEKGKYVYIDSNLQLGKRYIYRVYSVSEKDVVSKGYAGGSSVPVANLFNVERLNVLIFIVAFAGLFIYFYRRAKGGVELYVRPIAGLSAVDEAIGRATEMGKPILYVPGISGMSYIATIASINILSPVAKKAAEYDTPIIVPNRDPIVTMVAQEVVKEAYTEAGRPDAFKRENVFFLSDSQFAYAAGVDGIMVRERPATNLFIGKFFAESLILAETGNMTGAIQIAGTDAVAQLPFFIAACDYTIMGEELYAASAYLSRDPKLVGSIKAQDWGKALLMGLVVLGSILSLFNIDLIMKFFATI